MTSKDCSTLEKNFEFKKSYLNKTFWWLHISLAGPIILLFGGLVGVMYLFNNGMLVSWYAVPYIVIFAVATVWFKTMRVHLQRKMVNVDNTYLVCMAQPIGELNGYTYVLFVTADARRHEKRYIERLARNLPNKETIIKEHARTARKTAILLHSEIDAVDYNLKAYASKDISRSNAMWKEEDFFPILYISPQGTPIVKRKHILEYTG